MGMASTVSVDPSTTSVVVQLQGYAAVYSYVAFSAFEMNSFAQIVRSTPAAGDGTIVLPSLAPIPAAGDVTVATSTGGNIAVAGGDLILLTLAVASPTVNSFIPENVVTINGKVATPMAWVSCFAVMVQAPPNAAGSYNILYSDRRGTFTKASVTYA